MVRVTLFTLLYSDTINEQDIYKTCIPVLYLIAPIDDNKTTITTKLMINYHTAPKLSLTS